MKKKIRTLTILFMMIFGMFLVFNNNTKDVMAANDTSPANTDQFTSEAVSIDYSGGTSQRHGVQAYTGITGQLWVLGDLAAFVEVGAGSHKLGSNNTDGRSGLTLTFVVNSTVEGNYNLGIHGLFNEHSGCTVTVNNGTGVSLNLSETRGMVWSESVGAKVPVALVEGENTIVIVMQDNYTCWLSSFFFAEDTYFTDDSFYHNCPALPREAEEVPFTGETTIKYGVQSSAGISGPAWVVGNTVPVQDADVSHSLGSNVSDGRSGLKLTFKINSSTATDAILDVFAEFYGEDGTSAILNVNGVTSNINFYQLNSTTNNNAVPTPIPVTLVSGLNTITITMQENYGIWFASYRVAPVDAPEVLPTYSEVTVASYDSKGGDMSADAYAFGLNAYDDPANYGKTGSITYRFTTEEAGDYYLNLMAMAGAPLANRIKITVNDVVQVYEDKEYLALNTAAGWGGDSLNTVVVALQAGENTVIFENSLTRVDASKSSEVPEGTEGSVLVSNWWVHGVGFEKVPNIELLLDTSNVQKTFNLNREFNAEGLIVSLKVDEVITPLDSSEYTINSSAFDSSKYGNCQIVVSQNDSELTANYIVTITDQGLPYEGIVFEYEGGYTGANTNSFYKYAKIEGEGTEECEGRIFWTVQNTPLSDGGYKFGSNGVGEYENRQVTLTLQVNSAVSGLHLLKLSIQTNDRNNAVLTIKVNDEEAYDACLFYAGSQLPYMFEVNLKEGMNTIKLTSRNQYNFWFDYFEFAPIEYKEVNTILKSNQGVRWGLGLIDCDANDIWAATSTERAIIYYYNLAAGKYLVNLSTSCAGEKEAIVYVDDVAHNVTITNGTTLVPITVTGGNHRIEIYASGTNSDFSLTQVKVVKDIKPVALEINTENTNLEIPYDGILDTTTITVKVVYDDESKKELVASEFSIVPPKGYSTTTPGSYEFKVVLKADDTIFETFTVVVQEDTTSDPDTDEPDTDEPDTDEPDTDEPAKPGRGCRGNIIVSIVGLVSMLGTLIFIRRRKK